MAENNACACSSAPKLVFACSGAADVGALADQAARKMTRDDFQTSDLKRENLP